MNATNSLYIQFDVIGKKFGSEWIFKNINLNIKTGDKLAVLGGNGSGKSTLLQIISGYVLPNEGKLVFTSDKKNIEADFYKNYMSLASPYLELIEEFNLAELIKHTSVYKPFINNFSEKQIIEIAELTHTKDKAIKTYSSGMKQRVKLALAILADAPLLLLDEPASNLDKNALVWYSQMINSYAKNKTVIVCSNSINDEYEFCDQKLDLMAYK